MSQPAFSLSLCELLQLIRYELRLTKDEMARQCGLCPCCYADVEQVGDPELEPTVVAAIHEQLPHLSTLLLQRQGAEPAAEPFEARLSALEVAPPEVRGLTMARIRLELQWLDNEAV
ncbi:MAG: hypothetical protein H7338_08030 [Candidatus Sericytochromatia bacterium]|nr:hypothetical protein [Candidatus Sericytochromatia bacterium]